MNTKWRGEDGKKKRISNKSLKLSEKCQLRLSSSTLRLFFAPHCRSVRTKCTEKTILEQILDAPCRSILIRSSKNDSAVAYLLGIWFSSCTSVAHVEQPFSLAPRHRRCCQVAMTTDPNAKLRAFDWSLILSSSSTASPERCPLVLSLVGFDRFCGEISAAWFIKFVADAWEKSFTFAPVDEKRFIKISFLAEVVGVVWWWRQDN